MEGPVELATAVGLGPKVVGWAWHKPAADNAGLIKAAFPIRTGPPAVADDPAGAGNLWAQIVTWARGGLSAPKSRSFAADAQADSGLSPASELLQGLFDSLHEEVALIDERGIVIAINSAWRAGVCEAKPARSFVGANYVEVCAGLSPSAERAGLKARLRDVLSGRSATCTFEYESEGPAARRRVARLRRISSRGAAILIAIHEDAARPPATADLLVAQDEERQRIAMELHDSTSQHLVALGMGVARLRRMGGCGVDDVLEDMSRSVAEVVREIRVLSFLMRPPGLERLGLEATVRGFVQGFAIRTSLATQFRSEGAIDTAPPAVQHAAFRILQEALSNAFRHAEARGVDVELLMTGATLELRVSDNGRGIAGLSDGDLSRVPLGVGLVGMQARAAKLGGRLEITSQGRGTRVTAILPAGPEAG